MTRYQTSKEKFLEVGGDPNQFGYGYGSDWGILHEAIDEDDWEFIVWLVLHGGANPDFLTRRARNNALFFAYKHSVIKFLLWRGCDPGHINKGGIRSLIYYRNDESSRMIILRMMTKMDNTINIYLWREVAEWLWLRI